MKVGTQKDSRVGPEEVHTFNHRNIGRVGVVGTQSNINLGNGNTMPLAAIFIRTNGTPDVSGSLLLASYNFYREFTDDPEITQEAAALTVTHGKFFIPNVEHAA